MSYAGTVHGGIIELEGDVELPEGTRVQVIPEPDQTQDSNQPLTFAEWLVEARKIRARLPVTSDSTDLIRQMRLERASR